MLGTRPWNGGRSTGGGGLDLGQPGHICGLAEHCRLIRRGVAWGAADGRIGAAPDKHYGSFPVGILRGPSSSSEEPESELEAASMSTDCSRYS